MDESKLIGMELVNGWVIEKQRRRLPDPSGGENSLSYVARHRSGGQAFVKLLDPTVDEGAGDQLADLKLRLDTFQYGRLLLDQRQLELPVESRPHGGVGYREPEGSEWCRTGRCG